MFMKNRKKILIVTVVSLLEKHFLELLSPEIKNFLAFEDVKKELDLD